MKKPLLSLLFILLMLISSSCGVSSAVYSNLNQNATQVQLASNNYKIIDKVSGSVETKYIFLIGGMNHRQQYENAYSTMVSKANLINEPRALVHLVNEEHFRGFFPFYFTRKITYTAHVIEFTK
jgi:hypothetical protein